MFSKNRFEILGFKSKSDLIDFLDRPETILFIGKNYEHYKNLWIYYYEKKVEKIKPPKVKGRFVWISLLSPFIWLFYRKMYLWLGSFFLLIAGYTFLDTYFGWENSFSPIFLLTLLILVDGQVYYLEHVRKTIDKAFTLSNEKRAKFLHRRGGTSLLLAGLSVPTTMILVVTVDYFAYSLTDAAQTLSYWESP